MPTLAGVPGAGCIDDDALLAFADHRLPATDAEAVSAHVAGCPDCRQVLVELARDDSASSVEPQLRRGAELGRYMLADVLGTGGMGIVYAARDEKLGRSVAVKVLKDARHSARFEHERRILATLDHPHIARLLDGGETPEGRAYLVMERIDGTPLTTFCDARALGVEARLRLFRDVCSAVQFAHQNLVVHRDLKPGNILVTADGAVKLLDFGIAKLLETDEVKTATGVLAMTPAFASPEQVRQEPITTASDVYALGVVLFELLTGASPYRVDRKNLDALLAAVREQEPTPPSAAVAFTAEPELHARGGSREKLKRRLEGDLDAIVLMALRKEPRGRYATAEAFSEDVRRHLEGLPAAARRGDATYRLGKWVRRHKVAVAAALTGLVFLAGGTVATAWQAAQASRERDRAEARFAQVRKLAHAMLFDYHDGIAQLPGSTALRETLVKDALGYLDTLAAESAEDVALQRELATAYLKIGTVQGDPYSASLGDSAGALASYRRAELLAEHLLQVAPQDLEAMRVLAQAQLKVGDLLGVTGDAPGGIAAYKKAIALNEKIIALPGVQPDDRYELSMGWYALGETLVAEGKLDEGLEAHRAAMKVREALVAESPTVRRKRGLAASHVMLADVLSKRGEVAAGLKEYDVAMQLYEALVVEAPVHESDLGPLYQRVGVALLAAGQAVRAAELMRKSLNVAEARVAADPNDAVGQRNLAGSYSTLADVLLSEGKLSEGVELQRKVLGITRRLSAEDPGNAQAARDVSVAAYEVGRTLRKAKDFAGAEVVQREALALTEKLLAGDEKSVVFRADLADVLQQIGALKHALHQPGAAADHERARGLYEAVVAEAPASAVYQAGLASTYADLGRGEKGAVACGWWKKSVDAWGALQAKGALPAENAEDLAEATRAASLCR